MTTALPATTMAWGAPTDAPHLEMHGSASPLRVAGLFAGIGGIELGLGEGGHRTELLCEIDDYAFAVLKERLGGDCRLERDVGDIPALPDVDLVTAGFPCQDLSQAGATAGIRGHKSGVVEKLFELLQSAPESVQWVLIENVPFMLHLDRGSAMHYLTAQLREAGFSRWAYRVVNSNAFGLPHRRLRVFLLASREGTPWDVLLADEAGPPPDQSADGKACGFYWTEGIRGLGWAIDAIPTLKGGSGVGIPSPPAILMPDGRIVTPSIEDAERLQGFDAGWTAPAAALPRGERMRWRLAGNAVTVRVAAWVGRRVRAPADYDPSGDRPLSDVSRWPAAAWCDGTTVYGSGRSAWPVRVPAPSLESFLGTGELKPLSLRATAGFKSRMDRSKLNFPPGFREAVADHHRRMGGSQQGS